MQYEIRCEKERKAAGKEFITVNLLAPAAFVVGEPSLTLSPTPPFPQAKERSK